MKFLAVNIYCCALLFLLVNSSETLRCFSGNQSSNDQLHKIMETCRKKHSVNENKNGKDYGAMSSEKDSSDEEEESSDSFDEEMFFGNNKKSGRNHSRNGENYGKSSDGNYGENRRNDRRKQNSSGSRPYFSNNSSYASTNDRGSGMSNMNDNRNYRNGMQSQNREDDNDDRRIRTECVTQCFFDELNLVDRRGFPKRGSIMEMMTRGVQDPMIRDFISESIAECFRYLDSDMNNREKCAFSNNLMSCFADKGRECIRLAPSTCRVLCSRDAKIGTINSYTKIQTRRSSKSCRPTILNC